MTNYKSTINDILQSENATHKSLAAAIGVSPVTLSRWIHGQSIPSQKHLDKLAEIALDPSAPEHALEQRKKRKPIVQDNPYPQALKKIQLITGMTQTQLAEALDTYPATLSRWLSGRHMPTRLAKSKIRQLAKKILDSQRDNV